jgi:hypothetical protein
MMYADQASAVTPAKPKANGLASRTTASTAGMSSSPPALLIAPLSNSRLRHGVEHQIPCAFRQALSAPHVPAAEAVNKYLRAQPSIPTQQRQRCAAATAYIDAARRLLKAGRAGTAAAKGV